MKRHPLDYLSLIFGALFVTIALFFALRAWEPFTIDARWIAPVILVALGLAFLVPSRRRPAPQVDEPTQEWTGDLYDPELEQAKDELPPSPL